MSIFSFVCLITLSIKNLQARENQEIFKRNWNFSPLIVRSEDKSRIHTKIFKRQMWIGKIPMTIADTSLVFLENPKKDQDQSKNEIFNIAENIKKTFGQRMIISGDRNNLIVEGPFEKINRYIKITLIKNPSSVSVISSFVRLGFYKKIDSEIAELHLALSKYDGKLQKEKKTSWYNGIQIINDAHAQVMGLDLFELIDGQNVNTDQSTNLFSSSSSGNSFEEINTNIGALSNSLQETNTSIGQLTNQTEIANTNWANTNVEMTRANDTAERIADEAVTANRNWVNTNAEITKANETAEKFADEAVAANTNWANTNEEIGRANDTAEKFADEAKAVNTNWAESNKILAKTLNPQHMAKVAFYTAAGAALGGVAVNLAVQGVSEGISFLHELFTGEKQKKLEWSDFEKAIAAWDTQLNDLVKMEQIVDNLLGAFDFFEGKKLGNDYLKQLTMATREMKFDKEEFLEKSRDKNLDQECRKTYFFAAEELDQKIKEYENIIDFMKKNNLSGIGDSETFFCSQIKQLQKRILDAETQMQDLRLKILVAENQFYKKQREAIDKRDKDLNKSNSKLSKTLKEKNKYEEKIEKRVKKDQVSNRNLWLASCMKGQNEQGKAIKEEFSKTFFIFSHFKRKSRCKEEFEKVALRVYGIDDKEDGIITAEEELRRTLDLRANTSVEMKQSKEQISWLSKIHMDAYCYQFSHKKIPLPKKCRDFPETLYSLSLSRGYNKASEAYKNKCEARYVSGLMNLVKDDP